MSALGLQVVAKKKAPKNALIRMTEDAMKWAKIASGYTGESVPDYVSRVISEMGRKDAERLHSKLLEEENKPKR